MLTRMIALPDGALAASYQFFRWGQSSRDGVLEGSLQLLVSGDSGSWEGPHTIGALRVYGNAGDESLMIKGLGGGQLAARPGDPLRIHATWSTIVDGYLQIVLATSADGGRTWSEPVRVNDGGLASNHSNPMVAVNAAGHVAVSWNDRREDPEDRCFRPRVAVSIDGGDSFLPSAPLSATPACPPVGRWLNGGDTQGLVALPGGAFQAAWIGPAQEGEGTLQLWTSRVAVR